MLPLKVEKENVGRTEKESLMLSKAPVMMDMLEQFSREISGLNPAFPIGPGKLAELNSLCERATALFSSLSENDAVKSNQKNKQACGDKTPTDMIFRKANGERHREDGPAVIRANGDREWYQHGDLHREDGPAVERANGDKEWWANDVLHREDGPAVEHADGTVEYWIDGEQVEPPKDSGKPTPR
jgi:hypothetical protein